MLGFENGAGLKKRSGFTLLEIMVVVTITILLSGMILVYNHSTQRQLILIREQAAIMGAIYRSKSLTLQKYNVPPNIGCGFGLYFPTKPNPADYILFEKIGTFQTCSASPGYNAGSDLIIQNFAIDPSLKLTNPNPQTTFLFLAPDVTLVANKSFPIQITLQTNDTPTLTVDTFVSAFGQI